MADESPQKHLLSGFAESAIHFLRALEDDRENLAVQHGISSSELRALFRIAEAGSMTPKELAAELGLTSGAITGISTRLVASGMLTRVAHPHDRRSLRLELTPEGNVRMAHIHREFAAMVDEATSKLGDHALETATTSLREVTRALRERLTMPASPMPQNAITPAFSGEARARRASRLD